MRKIKRALPLSLRVSCFESCAKVKGGRFRVWPCDFWFGDLPLGFEFGLIHWCYSLEVFLGYTLGCTLLCWERTLPRVSCGEAQLGFHMENPN